MGGNRWKDVTLEDRLLDKSRINHEHHFNDMPCWDWIGAATKKGYGITSRNGKRIQATRAAYELWRGPVAEGLELDHLCRRPCCINPWHLEPVTRRENLMRSTSFAAVHAAKTHCPQGHPYSEENTYVRKGMRHCRTCHRDRPETPHGKRDREGRCRICGFTRDMLRHPPPKNGWLTMHHLIPRLQSGQDHTDNLVPLCFRCHRIIDSHKPANIVEREDLRRTLRALLTPAEVDYINLIMGRGYIDRQYPLAETPKAQRRRNSA